MLRMLLMYGAGIFLASGLAHGALTIEITKGAEGAQPIAVVPFGWQGPLIAAPVDVAEVIAADLRRSGRFAPLSPRDMVSRPREKAEVKFSDWRLLGTEYLVVGKVQSSGVGYTVQFELFDVLRSSKLLGLSKPVAEGGLRRVAHQIADQIYETLTGEPGAFDTRIAYVSATQEANNKRSHALYVADVDGYNAQSLVQSQNELMSPSWSPDGTRLAYVSYSRDRPEIYVVEVRTGKRDLISSFPGLNNAPVWSPDGGRMAMTLSKDGNAEIYVLHLTSRKLTRLTENFAIDTEPTWSPDGQYIAFTSDRGGQPQIYRMKATGGEVQRLTFEGKYNARPVYSPDGTRIAMMHGDGQRFNIAVLDLKNKALQVLTDGVQDESPSFAPNGRMIIYATESKRRGVLSAASVDGRVRQRLSMNEGDTREPAWSPWRVLGKSN